MLEWFRAANVLASRSKRASRSASMAQRIRQNLDGDLPIKVGVGGAIYLTHAAHADLSDDFVRAKPGARGKCHYAPGILRDYS